MTSNSDHIQILINKLIKSIESDPIDFLLRLLTPHSSLSEDAVADAENIFRIHRLLAFLQDPDAVCRLYPRHKILADLADAVMMGQGAAVRQYDLPQGVFDLAEDRIGLIETFAVDPHGEIDTDARMI